MSLGTRKRGEVFCPVCKSAVPEGHVHVCPSTSKVAPEHYHRSGITPLDVIDAWGLDFRLGNVVKYLCRHRHKGDPAGDIRKALDYLGQYLERLEGEETS